jgi:hypothetical protein
LAASEGITTPSCDRRSQPDDNKAADHSLSVRRATQGAQIFAFGAFVPAEAGTTGMK